jgi:hypothetical protein
MTKIDNTLRNPNEEVVVLRNGTRVDPKTRHFISGPVEGKITVETSQELLKAKREKRRQHVEAGIIDAVSGKTGKAGISSDEAMQVISEAVAKTALNPSSSRQIEAAKFSFEKAGWETQDPPNVADDTLKMDRGFAELLLAVMESYDKRNNGKVDIVEGEVKDA